MERLLLKARVWEPAAEALVAEIGIEPGARCLDLGVRRDGHPRPLSRAAGPLGRVVGVAADAVARGWTGRSD